MPKYQNVYRRGAIYYCRFDIALSSIQKYTFRLSLKTAQQCLARRIGKHLSVIVEELKMEFRGRGRIVGIERQKEIFSAALTYKRDRLLEQARLTLERDRSEETLQKEIGQLDLQKAMYLKLPEYYNQNPQEAAKDFVDQNKLDSQPASVFEQNIEAELEGRGRASQLTSEAIECSDLMPSHNVRLDAFKAVCDGFVQAAEDVKSYIRSSSSDDAFDARSFMPSKETGQNGASILKLSEVIKEFSEEKISSGQWRSKSAKQNEAQLAHLMEIIGDKAISEISMQDAKQFKGVISKLPPNISKVRDARFKGKSLAQIAELDHEKRLNPKTVNQYIQGVSSLFIWAMDQEYCVKDYFKRLKITLPKVKASKERDAFTVSELKQIERKAIEEKDQWKKWVVLIGEYSGMRLNEICQLYLDDIAEVEGILCFKLTDKRDDQKLKSLDSIRDVPVHPKLIELGFEEYVALIKRQKSERLFPKFKYSKDNGYSHKASKWFGRTFMNKLDLGEGNKVFHSFRHSMATELQRAGVEESIVSALLGHASQSITYNRYGKGFSVEQLRDAVNRFNASAN